MAERRTRSARSCAPMLALARPGPRAARGGTVERGRVSAWASLSSSLLGWASTRIASVTVAMWRALRLRACWKQQIYIRLGEKTKKSRDGLDFVLEALLFFGCELDLVGEICVRLRCFLFLFLNMAMVSDAVGSFGWGEGRNARRRHCRNARGELGICRYGRSSVHILLLPAHEESR